MRRFTRLQAEISATLAHLCLGVLAASLLPRLAEAQTPLMLPSAIVFDSQGNLFFAEAGNHVVRRFSTAGIITTVAGTGVQGFAGDGGPATDSELDSPSGLALDAAGDLFIADTHNHRVREIAATTGVITTVAGTGTAGFLGDGASATSARLDSPTALAMDSAGNLYLADTGNQRVRRIAPATGIISTVAGNGTEGFAGDTGTATSSEIDSPSGLAVDSAGNLYVADTHNGRVRKVTAATGLISTVAGTSLAQTFTGDGGAATVAGLALPRGLTIDASGNIYTADAGNQRVRRISTAGTITTVAGQGTQAFAGDGTPAVAANLDSPRALAISPAGLLTLADVDNQRIRQLDALAAPGPDIHTIAGLGDIAPETLTLSGPAVAAYGSGSVTATLSATSASGNITFSDMSSGQAIQLGVVPLTGGSARWITSALAAGMHHIVGSYSGDTNHAAAQSSGLAITLTPLALAASANSVAILYGQPVPTLAGTLIGALPQDAGKVTAVFLSSASTLSPVGLYPISFALSGTAAPNYTVGGISGSVTIAKAPVILTLSPSTSSGAVGTAVTVNLQAASTTNGVPTGSATFMDGGAVLATVPLSTGSAAFTSSALTTGAHGFSAVYAGDTNFLGGSSTVATVTIGPPADFTMTANGATSQSVPAGSAATFAFTVATQGAAMSSPIILSVQGLPVGATGSLTPALLPPGTASSSFTLTIQTPVANLERNLSPTWNTDPKVLALLLMPLAGMLARKRSSQWRLLILAAVCGLLCTTGCGNRINTAAETTNSKTYTLTVTGTATSSTGAPLQHSVNVTLQVLQ